MKDIESYELIHSMLEDIKKEIEEAKSRKEEEKQKLKDTTKKISMLDKFSIDYDIKLYENKIIGLTKLNYLVEDLRPINKDKYTLPEDLKSQFDRLGTLLSKQEIEQLISSVRDCLGNFEKEKRENTKQKVAEIQKILKELKMGDHRFLIYNMSHQYAGSSTSYNDAVKYAQMNMLTDLTEHFFINSSDQVEIELEIRDKLLLSSLEEMIEDNQLEKNKSTQNIIDNFSLIKEAFGIKAKLEEILFVLDNTLFELGEITEVDFSKVQSYLKHLENDYRKELDKTNKFLNKFDFSDAKKQIQEKKVQEEKDRLENSKITEYQQLSYELEKVMSENPNDYKKIQQLKEAMRQVAVDSELTKTQLDTALIDGKIEYERQKQKTTFETVKEETTYKDQLEADVMRQIRECAIQELESSGAFKEIYEFRNGDVYTQPMDRETMIKREMQNLLRLAEMTPEQRGLEELKKSGLISPLANLEDLTPQQIMDFRTFYRDSSYGFMADYKRLKSYAEQIHNIENTSDDMDDEELKEEFGGMSI